MLRKLHIRNYILIDSLDIEFPEGLQIITGSTGAGKSILLGALSLLLGAKADASAISDGNDSLVVEAEFETDDEVIRQILEREDLEWDNGHLLIRRVVHSTGRSRAFVGDFPVQLSVLNSVSERLVDIHSQHQSLMLTDKAWQLSMLDAWCGNTSLLSDCKTSFRRLQELKSELGDITRRARAISDEKDYKAALLGDLEKAKLNDEEELGKLESEQKELSNAEEIKDSLATCCNYLSPEDENSNGILLSLKEIEKQLERISQFVPSVSSLKDRISSSRLELDDIFNETERLNSEIIVSPERLYDVEQRMSLIYELFRKHNRRTVSELIELRDTMREEALDSDNLTDKIRNLEKEISEEEKRFRELSGTLHSRRMEKKDSFASKIEDKLRYLELDKAVFKVSLDQDTDSATGFDKVCFLFDASSREPSDISKCASGGELSRIMLCLKDIMARYKSMPTMIFDEIDTGVSGSVADKMGTMICEMGANMQVFAITHLPQVAAKGSAHFLVTKSTENGLTRSGIKKLSPEERVMEIARMLSGSTVTGEAIANAKSLLGL